MGYGLEGERDERLDIDLLLENKKVKGFESHSGDWEVVDSGVRVESKLRNFE